MSINNDKNVDMDIDNYNPSELFQILNIQSPTKSGIIKASDDLINKFTKEGNQDLANFLKKQKNDYLRLYQNQMIQI